MSFLKIFDAEYTSLSLWNFAFFIFGIIWYFALENEPSFYYIISLSMASLLTLYLRKYGTLGILLSGIIISFAFGVMVAKIRNSQIHTIELEEELISNVKGRVSKLKHTPRGLQVTLENIQFNKLLMQDEDPQKVRISIGLDNAKNILMGDTISILAALSPPSRSILPGGYDFGLYTYFSGIGATGFALGKITNYSNNDHNASSYLHKIRKTIYYRLTDIMGKDNGNFAAALFLGEAGGLGRIIMQNMRYAGLSHVLCVSGLHLSLVAGIFFITSRVLLNLSNFIAWNFNIKIISALISLLGSGIYLMLSGTQIAATRAYIMTSIFMVSIIVSRVPYPLRSLGIAAVFMLSLNPEYILHPSFQLSFAAVLALIGGYEFYIRNRWILGESGGLISTIKIGIFSNIYSSLLASLATTPIVIYHFYTVPNYSVLANLLVVPLVSLIIMPLGVLAMLLMPLGMDYYIWILISQIIHFITQVADWVTHLPGAIWYFGYITPEALCIYLFGLFWVMLWNTKLRFYGLVIIVFSMYMMVSSPKPDVIFDAKAKILGVKNKDEQLEITAFHLSDFTKTYWSNWFGSKDSAYKKENIEKTNYHLLTDSGKVINILYQPGYSYPKGDLDIIPLEYINKGAILIFCDNIKCNIRLDDRKRFRFHIEK